MKVYIYSVVCGTLITWRKLQETCMLDIWVTGAKNGQGLNLKDDTIFEENTMKHFDLTIIARVESGQPRTQKKLDDLEGRFQKNLITMNYHGGMKIRHEKKRRTRKTGT